MNELDTWIEEAAQEIIQNRILIANLLKIQLRELDLDYLYTMR